MASVKQKRGFLPDYTAGEELMNAITHGIGALLSVIGSIVLLTTAIKNTDAIAVAAAIIYGAALILLYTMSMLYHAINNEKAKRLFRIFDHSTIFLLIAGTYTPYTLVTMREVGIWGYLVFGLVWGCAVVGIILNSFSVERFKKISLFLYVASGWAAVITIKPLIENLAPNGLILMLVGGIFYTVGIIFYKMKNRKFFHGIWHLFVLCGSASHFFSILLYIYQ